MLNLVDIRYQTIIINISMIINKANERLNMWYSAKSKTLLGHSYTNFLPNIYDLS